MSRRERFTIRISTDEAGLINELAEILQRSQSDAVRFVIRQAVGELCNTAEVKTKTVIGIGAVDDH